LQLPFQQVKRFYENPIADFTLHKITTKNKTEYEKNMLKFTGGYAILILRLFKMNAIIRFLIAGRDVMIYRERALRHEYKFPATAAQCEILRERFSAVMTPDAHGENGCYRITSVYLDDVYWTAYNDKLIGADTRKKYRIRTYDLSDKLLHFECKYKDRDMTSKRGIWISPEQYYSILRGDYSFVWSGEYEGTILEDASYSNSLALLRPSVIVDYKRQAFINPEGNVRFTIDSGFKAGAFSDDMLSQSVRYLPVEDFTAVIEIKYDDYLPSYLMDLLGGIELRQDSVSKFILCHDKLTSLNMRT
jgi:hypothetical protein